MLATAVCLVSISWRVPFAPPGDATVAGTEASARQYDSDDNASRALLCLGFYRDPPLRIVHPTCGEHYTPKLDGVFRTGTSPIDTILVAVFPRPSQLHSGQSNTALERVVTAMMKSRASSREKAGNRKMLEDFMVSSKAHVTELTRNDASAAGCQSPFSGKSSFSKTPSMKLFDAVFTYVSPTSLTFQRDRSQFCRDPVRCHTARFRDWGELRYSMRSAFSRAGHLIRNYVLVVADDDHVPAWLICNSTTSNQSVDDLGFVHIVRHRDIFLDAAAALPTFNSHAIEANLHRIPGLSRFFIYFNNDMLLGKTVHFFDYWRPISSFRARLRWLEWNCSGITSFLDESALMDQVVMFEPIVYHEGLDRDSLCQLRTKITSASPHPANKIEDPCRSTPINVQELFELRCLLGTRSDLDHSADFLALDSHWRRLRAYNARLFYDRLNGYFPTFRFAHYPVMFDRLLLEQMHDVEFRDASDCTSLSRVRGDSNLWTTLMYQHYVVASRHGVENALVLQHKHEGAHLLSWSSSGRLLEVSSRVEKIVGAEQLEIIAPWSTLIEMPTSRQVSGEVRRLKKKALHAGCDDAGPDRCLESLRESLDYESAQLRSYAFHTFQQIENVTVLLDEFKSMSPSSWPLFITLNDDVGVPPMGRLSQTVKPAEDARKIGTAMIELLEQIVDDCPIAPFERA